MAREELTRLTGNGNGECNQNDCPNVYRTASGSFVVQGNQSDACTPPNEQRCTLCRGACRLVS
jgi:hypothetical protein